MGLAPVRCTLLIALAAATAATVVAGDFSEALKQEEKAIQAALAEAATGAHGDVAATRAVGTVADPGQAASKDAAAGEDAKPERGLSRYDRGCAYMLDGEYRRAEKEFLRELRENGSAPDLHFNLGILYDDHLHRPAKARQHYRLFLRLAPRDEDAPRVREWLLWLP